MRFLLDTHIMLWWSLGDERLSSAGRGLLSDEKNECFVSIASLWEVAIKSSLGRGMPQGITAMAYAELIDEAGFILKDVQKAHALSIEALGLIHGDPFDRLMVGQAKTEGFTFLTSDKVLAAYGEWVKLL